MSAFRAYLHGLDILGAETNRAVMVRIKNVAEVVRDQGGAAGAIAQQFAPVTIENEVYKKIAEEFARGLKAKNIDAVVTVVDAPSPDWKPVKGSRVVQYTAIGVGGAGLLGLGAWLFMRMRRSR